MTLADVMIECTGVGIKLATVEQAFGSGEFPALEDAKVRPSEPITLLTMTDASFVGIVASLFDVFGGEACVVLTSSCRCSRTWWGRTRPVDG